VHACAKTSAPCAKTSAACGTHSRVRWPRPAPQGGEAVAELGGDDAAEPLWRAVAELVAAQCLSVQARAAPARLTCVRPREASARLREASQSQREAARGCSGCTRCAQVQGAGPPGGRAGVRLRAWLAPRFFERELPAAAATARAALLARLPQAGCDDAVGAWPAGDGSAAGLAAGAAEGAAPRGAWADEAAASGAAPADAPGLRDLVYGLMRPTAWTAEAIEPPGAGPAAAAALPAPGADPRLPARAHSVESCSALQNAGVEARASLDGLAPLHRCASAGARLRMVEHSLSHSLMHSS